MHIAEIAPLAESVFEPPLANNVTEQNALFVGSPTSWSV
jgi:hypothetical protein